jgi:hypothetical protein
MTDLQKLVKCKKYLFDIIDGLTYRDIIFVTGMPESEAKEIIRFSVEERNLREQTEYNIHGKVHFGYE